MKFNHKLHSMMILCEVEEKSKKEERKINRRLKRKNQRLFVWFSFLKRLEFDWSILDFDQRYSFEAGGFFDNDDDDGLLQRVSFSLSCCHSTSYLVHHHLHLHHYDIFLCYFHLLFRLRSFTFNDRTVLIRPIDHRNKLSITESSIECSEINFSEQTKSFRCFYFSKNF